MLSDKSVCVQTHTTQYTHAHRFHAGGRAEVAEAPNQGARSDQMACGSHWPADLLRGFVFIFTAGSPAPTPHPCLVVVFSLQYSCLEVVFSLQGDFLKIISL